MFLSEVECEDEIMGKLKKNPSLQIKECTILKNDQEKVKQILELLHSQRKKMEALF
jgi:hypothetical protein